MVEHLLHMHGEEEDGGGGEEEKQTHYFSLCSALKTGDNKLPVSATPNKIEITDRVLLCGVSF